MAKIKKFILTAFTVLVTFAGIIFMLMAFGDTDPGDFRLGLRLVYYCCGLLCGLWLNHAVKKGYIG